MSLITCIFYDQLKKKIRDDLQNAGYDFQGGDIDQERQRALSTLDVEKLMEGKTKILTYPILSQYTNINQLLDPYNQSCIFLYLAKEKYGHYCAIVKRNGKICFFDPYGGEKMPDEQLKKINPEFRSKSRQDYPYLTKLLYEASEPIEYNEYRYQRYHPDVKTCGRHCICFVLSGLDIDGYHNKMKQLSKKYNMNYDDLVTLLTSNIVK